MLKYRKRYTVVYCVMHCVLPCVDGGTCFVLDYWIIQLIVEMDIQSDLWMTVYIIVLFASYILLNEYNWLWKWTCSRICEWLFILLYYLHLIFYILLNEYNWLWKWTCSRICEWLFILLYHLHFIFCIHDWFYIYVHGFMEDTINKLIDWLID
jgi:hypothetical protein